jgi:hypothetical protein
MPRLIDNDASYMIENRDTRRGVVANRTVA